MGALGVVRPNGDFELALTIRTLAVAEGRVHLWVGGGIVWDSDPEAEIEESWVKARPILAARAVSRWRYDRAARGRGRRQGPRRSVAAGLPPGRRGAPPRRRRVRDRADPRAAGPCSCAATSSGCAARASRCGSRRRTASRSSRAQAVGAAGDRRGRAAPLPDRDDAARDGRSRSRPDSRSCAGGASPSSPSARRAPACSPASRRRATRPRSPRSPRPRRAAPTTRSTSARARRCSRRPCRTSGGARTTSSSTPALSTGVLPGVTRGAVAALAQQAGYRIREGSFTLPALLRAEEAFTSSAVREIMPIVAVDGRELPRGDAAPRAAGAPRGACTDDYPG